MGWIYKRCYSGGKKCLFSIRLWDQGTLLNEIVKYYEQFEDELKAELPLKRIWTLVEEESD
jgi:restriction system protein